MLVSTQKTITLKDKTACYNISSSLFLFSYSKINPSHLDSQKLFRELLNIVSNFLLKLNSDVSLL